MRSRTERTAQRTTEPVDGEVIPPRVRRHEVDPEAIKAALAELTGALALLAEQVSDLAAAVSDVAVSAAADGRRDEKALEEADEAAQEVQEVADNIAAALQGE